MLSLRLLITCLLQIYRNSFKELKPTVAERKASVVNTQQRNENRTSLNDMSKEKIL